MYKLFLNLTEARVALDAALGKVTVIKDGAYHGYHLTFKDEAGNVLEIVLGPDAVVDLWKLLDAGRI